VAERCDFVGPAGEVDHVDLFARARVVVVTAADEDYGYVPLEAYLSGKAVLTVRDAGGPLEFVEDGRTGIVTEPDVRAIGTALAALWDRPAELSALARAGKARVEKITWRHAVGALLSAAGL
jgi:glycosyltransferase involved in cell wall biosynthesis